MLFARYGITTIEEFADKNILPFDARRVDYETVLPAIRSSPARFYLPRGLDEREVEAFRARIIALQGSGARRNLRLGYHDASAEGRFTEYVARPARAGPTGR